MAGWPGAFARLTITTRAIDGEVAVNDLGHAEFAFVDVSIKGPPDIHLRNHTSDPIPSVKPLPKRKFKVP